MGGRTLLLDPWFNAKPDQVKRLVPPAVTAEQVRYADLIFVSHFAYDHCDNFDISTINNRTFAHVIAPDEVLANLTVPDRFKVSASVGDSFHYYGIDVQVMPTRHGQGDQSVGYILSAGRERLYFAGDTYDFYGLSDVDADVGIVPIGGTYTMDVLSAISALKKMRLKRVIPCHYDTFDRIRANPHDFARKVEAETKSVPVVLSVGQTFDF
jgi:L-ascorbate metabolism protein UlaG (beta-lactamase superfamily)